MTDLTPHSEDEIVTIVQSALADNTTLEICGHGSKRALGRPVQAAQTVSLREYSGVTMYEPDELVISAKAGTSLTEIEELLAQHNQCLAFEPMDYAPLLGSVKASGTIGGMLATNLSGPRRLKAGAARDHILGVRVVSGRGELFKSGGRVVKNVTGYDLSKLMAGSWGTLGIVTEVTFKVLPQASTVKTLAVYGLMDDEAVRVMAMAMGSREDVSSAAHLPPTIAPHILDKAFGFQAVTLLRVEGIGASVDHRIAQLVNMLGSQRQIEIIDAAASAQLWREIRDVKPFSDGKGRIVWRVSMAPMAGHEMVAALRLSAGVDAYYDWQGGLVWLQMEAGAEAEQLRHLIEQFGGGHATLIRAPEQLRAQIDVFQPQAPALAALSQRLRQQFDPQSILNPGRMYCSPAGIEEGAAVALQGGQPDAN